MTRQRVKGVSSFERAVRIGIGVQMETWADTNVERLMLVIWDEVLRL